MSDGITTAMVDTYNTGIEMLAQQKQSKLLDRVRTESKTGERNSFDQVGVVGARKKSGRHADVKYINSPHFRRWVMQDHWEVPDLLDEEDMIEILNNPGGAYSEAFIAALNRERDAEIVRAARAPAFTGKKGTEIVNLPAANVVPHGGTGMTLDKVSGAMRRLKTANAVEGDSELTLAWTAAQEEEFINLPEVKSVDFNNQRVLVSGGMEGKFYGFSYVRLEDWTDEEGALHRILPKTGTVRSCIAWVKDGLLLNNPRPPRVRVKQLAGKGYSWQYYGSASFGATRMQESKVIEIEVQEAA